MSDDGASDDQRAFAMRFEFFYMAGLVVVLVVAGNAVSGDLGFDGFLAAALGHWRSSRD